MESGLTISSIAALFGTMVVLAFIPSFSVLAVSARSVTCGFTHGAFTAIGIVVGDIIFILLAIYGLSILAETMGSFFILVKYLGGMYLIWLGSTLWLSKSDSIEVEGTIESSLLLSFLSGLFITLSDLKAILFYLGFFPAFMDLSAITIIDTSIIIVVAAIAVGGPKLCYAFLADRTSLIFKSTRAKKVINITAGSVLIGVGAFLVISA